tara:strand:+ start:1042 stop:1290 length:249 start_codon:yes stop_codon:yes gene_type:complete
MTQLDINGNTNNKSRSHLTAKVKNLPKPVRFEVQQWGRIWIKLPDGGTITFFADEEPKLLAWVLDNGEEVLSGIAVKRKANQ